MPEYVVEPTALYKILLHALKYPSAPVCGVLLAKTANKDVIQFADAIPMLHTPILSLPVEIALAQVLGFYQANERADDTQLGGATRKVADVIATALAPEGLRGTTCALLVNTAALKQALHQQQAAAIFDVHTMDGKTWSKGAAKASLPPVADVHGAMQRHVAAGRHTQVVDFEDHLEDITKSWLNEALLS